jgi:alpha-beta hydrolase superfamily lysophospholipase
MPEGKAPFPVVLIVAGSGLTDRDGNTVGRTERSDSLRLLAEELAQRGIASLRYDKRGVAKSAPARLERNAFDTQFEDAALWVAWLGHDGRFRSVGIIGHSEGALVGTLAAQRGGVKAFVSLARAGRHFDQVLVGQFERAAQAGQLSKQAVAALKQAVAELRAVRSVNSRPKNVPDELWKGLFQPRAQEYLITLFRYDPVAELRKLPPKDVQVMVVRGTTDLMGGDDDAMLLATAAGVKPVIIPGMNHELKTAPMDRAANDRASSDPRVPLAPELMPQLTTFLLAALK